MNRTYVLSEQVRRHGLDRLLSTDLSAALRPVRHSAGELVLRAGDPVRDLLFLVEGNVKVFATMENGHNLLAAFCRPFEVFGEMELFSLPRTTLNVEAVGETLCLALPLSRLRAAEDRNGRLFRFLCGRLGTKLASRITTASINLRYPVENRLASYLLASTDPGELAGGTDDLGEIADFIGTSYRQLARVVKRFREAGILSRTRGKIQVADRSRLVPLARDLYVQDGLSR